MDFVTDLDLKNNFSKKAEIANETIFHKNSNVYHQHHVKDVKLVSFQNKYNIKINIVDQKVPEG